MNFLCHATNQGGVQAALHFPYPGTRVIAADATAAALAYATSQGLPPGTKVRVIQEDQILWFDVGGVQAATPPAYT